MTFGSAIRRLALLVAALLVVTGSAGALHVHRGEAGTSPLEAHEHPACALCSHADQSVALASAPVRTPRELPRLFAAIAPPATPLPVAPRGSWRGRAPPADS